MEIILVNFEKLLIVQMIVMPRSREFEFKQDREKAPSLADNEGHNGEEKSARKKKPQEIVAEVSRASKFINFGVMDIEALKSFYGESIMATTNFK